MFFEKIICKILSIYLRRFRPGIDDKAAVAIFMKMSAIIGFIIETGILIVVSLVFQSFYLFLMFFLVFGLLRIHNAEHYEWWTRCMITTTLIFIVVLVAAHNFSINVLTDVTWCVAVSLLFRDWHMASQN